MKFRNTFLAVILAVISIINLCVFTSCSSDDDVMTTATAETVETAEKTTVKKTTEATTTTKKVDPEYFNVLTGIACTKEEAERRPVAVMINNIKKAIPQYGISSADIIYECNAEGGVNRLMALFSDPSKASTIGSVRSARDYFVKLAVKNNCVFVHAGGSPEAYSYISNKKVENIDGVNGGATEGNSFWRDAYRRKTMGYEHSLMTSGENIASAINKLGFSENRDSAIEPMYKFNKSAVALESGTESSSVFIPHSNSIKAQFDYNKDDGLYYRSQFGKAHIDAGNDNYQLRFTNVVLLFTQQKVIDKKGRLDVTITGEGDGYYLYGGKYIPIKWKNENTSETSPMSLFNTDGTPLKLNPGKTFISICSNSIYNKIKFS